MKNWKCAAMGFAAGAVCMVTTTALATNFEVTAYLSPSTTFKINTVNVPADSDMPVLNYKDRVYVPIRFVADKLECDISWDAVTKQVTINSPEPEVIEKEVIKEVEKIVYVDRDESSDNAVYRKLPIENENLDYSLKVVGMTYSENQNSTKVFVRLENKSDYNYVYLNQYESKIIYGDNEKEYGLKQTDYDKKWDNNLEPNYGSEDRDDNEVVEGYLIFQGNYKDYSTLTIEVPLTVSGSGKEEIVETFHVKVNE